MNHGGIVYGVIVWMSALFAEESSWVELSPNEMTLSWELKENGFHSRRLSKKAVKKIEPIEDEFVIESHYQSRGKFLCTKKEYTNFIFEAEVMVNDLRSGAFVGYHGQFLNRTWKSRSKPYKALHSFTYSMGEWPKTTGEAEIRYTGSKSLIPDHKEIELKKEKWHKIKIVASDNTIQHWFDGQLVAELKQVHESLSKEKLNKSDDPLKGCLVLGMNGHPKGQKQVIKVKWRGVRVCEL